MRTVQCLLLRRVHFTAANTNSSVTMQRKTAILLLVDLDFYAFEITMRVFVILFPSMSTTYCLYQEEFAGSISKDIEMQ